MSRCKVLQAVADKQFAYIRSTTLVTKNKAQRLHIFHNAFSIIIARIGTATENTGNSFVMNQQTAGRTKQVTFNRYRSLELGNQRCFYNFFLFCIRAASTIEMDVLPALFEESFRKFQTNCMANITTSQTKRIQSFRKSMFHYIGTVN